MRSNKDLIQGGSSQWSQRSQSSWEVTAVEAGDKEEDEEQGFVIVVPFSFKLF